MKAALRGHAMQNVKHDELNDENDDDDDDKIYQGDDEKFAMDFYEDHYGPHNFLGLSYDFIMILIWFYYESKTSKDFLGLPKTS